MKRIVKAPQERRIEILNAAAELFRENGYTNTSVESIIKKVGVAKGTFYYYFKSKEDILSELVNLTVLKICENYKKIANNLEIDVIEKLRLMLRGQNQISKIEKDLMENIHKPENRELHERINIELILKISPIMVEVIEQGKKESVFNIENPLQTVQFLLAGSQFLLDSGLFNWNQEEKIKHMISMQAIIEKSLGAKQGSFSFIKEL